MSNLMCCDSSDESLSVRRALEWAWPQINSDSARLDAELLLLHTLGRSRAYLFSHSDELLTAEQADFFMLLLARRVKGEPIAYILQSREFWSLPLPLKVTNDTLIPRPDTERLVELALNCPLSEDADVLDLGSGSGAIACALAFERKQWSVLATEKSEAALNIIHHNIAALQLNNVKPMYSDWFQSLTGLAFDMIVSNPPYIAATDPHLNQGDVRFEPRSALVSGPTGLTDIAHIINMGRHFLKDRGWLLLEHGYDQGARVKQLLRDTGYIELSTEKDLAGHDRVTLGRWVEGLE